jgi:hypothetical protein
LVLAAIDTSQNQARAFLGNRRKHLRAIRRTPGIAGPRRAWPRPFVS